MPINILLRCKDANQTKDFYAKVLGFEVNDGDDASFAAIKEDCTLIFTQADLWNQAPCMTGTVYCFLSDVQAYYDRIKNCVALAWPLEQMSYGTREFAIIDCNGYTLAFAQDGANQLSNTGAAPRPA